MATEAMLVSRMGLLISTSRSISAFDARRSYFHHATAEITNATNRPTVSGRVQPHSAPLDTGSNRNARTAVSPSAPTASKRPPARVSLSGTYLRIAAPQVSAVAALTQNSACQLTCWAITAAKGSPSAPPTPRDALIAPIDEPSRSGGTMSRMIDTPTAMVPRPRPCSPRPSRNGSRLVASAQTTDPSATAAMLATRTRRLPNMSPRRPAIGVATAPTSSVIVSVHDALLDEVWTSSGSWGMSGTMMVCISATTMPPAQSTATATRGCDLDSGSLLSE